MRRFESCHPSHLHQIFPENFPPVKATEMYEDDPTMEERLQCDIEVDCTNGKAVAWVLRDLADKIEQEQLDDGHHDVKVPNGDKVGEVYLNYYAKTDI